MPLDMPPVVPSPEAIHACVVEAAERYDVPELLIYSILDQESRRGTFPGGRVGDTKLEGNGTTAFGPMQVTSVWLPELSRYGISANDLRWDLCVNIGVGTWILRTYYETHAQDWSKAIMSYNAGFKLKNGWSYARDVILRWRDYHAQAENFGNGG